MSYRHVPFLAQLGELYERLDDRLSAALEYGRAVDVLMEEPDPDRTAQAQHLYERIQRLAHYSLVTTSLAKHFRGTSAPELASAHRLE